MIFIQYIKGDVQSVLFFLDNLVEMTKEKIKILS